MQIVDYQTLNNKRVREDRNMRLKDFTELTPNYNEQPIDGNVSFVPMESLRNGEIDLKEIPFRQAAGKYTFFANGDLLIAKVTPCFENGNIAIANDLLNGVGFGSSEIFVLRVNKKKALNTYMFYVSETEDFQGKACATMHGVGGLKRIDPLFMRTYEFNLPPLEVQQRIVSYLDNKTAKIDRDVSLLQKKRDAYTRLKSSIINRAVTRGINPNVKLKDSGVDWIGMIPENWEVRRIKDIASNVFMGKTPEYCLEDNKNFIFGQRNNQVEGITFDGIKFGTDEFFKSRPKSEFLQYGDVLLNTLGGGSVGRTGYYNYRGENRVITDGHIMVIRSKVMDTRILYYFLSVRRRELENMAIGSTNQAFFNVSDIVTLFIPYPPTSEQHAIASYLDTHCSRIDHAISIVDKQIDAYTRLKKSLINEVVTGKRKV